MRGFEGAVVIEMAWKYQGRKEESLPHSMCCGSTTRPSLGGVPGKGCFVPGLIELEGDEPGFLASREELEHLLWGIANDPYHGFHMEGSHVSKEVRN